MGDENRTIWCGNLSDKVTEEVLYELFLQVAPTESVRIPCDKEGRRSNFGFVTLKHEVSVEYAVQLLDGTCLFDRNLTIRPRNINQNRQQNVEHQQQNVINFGELQRMDQMLEGMFPVANCEQRQSENYQRYDRRRKDYKPYNRSPHYGRHDNYQQGHNRQGKQPWNNHRGYDRGSNRRSRYY